MGFNNIFMHLIEDCDSRRDYEEALKIVETLNEHHKYSKLNSHLVVFRFAGMANFLSLSELINQIRREVIKLGLSSPTALRLKLVLSEMFLQVDALQQTWKELEQCEKELCDGKYK